MNRNITIAGLHATITDSRLCGHTCAIRKLDKDTYVVKSSGEIKHFSHSKSKDNLSSIRNSVKNFRDIVNANVLKRENCLFITLTYKHNMTDERRLWLDMKHFIAKFRSYCFDRYLYAVEPQDRGAWHIHLIAIWNEKAPYIKNDIIYKMWGHGFTKTQSIKKVRNVGLYLSSYLTDFGYTDKKGVFHCSKKGGRLSKYPKGMRIYRYSRNILRPESYRINPEKKGVAEAILMRYGFKFVSRSSSVVTCGGVDYDIQKKYFARPEDYRCDFDIWYSGLGSITYKPEVKNYDYYQDTDQIHMLRC